MLKHDEYVYIDFILNDMGHEYNDGYENDYGIHICSWKYDDDWDVDKWWLVYNEWYVSIITCVVSCLINCDWYIYIWRMYERDVMTENDDDTWCEMIYFMIHCSEEYEKDMNMWLIIECAFANDSKSCQLVILATESTECRQYLVPLRYNVGGI